MRGNNYSTSTQALPTSFLQMVEPFFFNDQVRYYMSVNDGLKDIFCVGYLCGTF